MKAKVRIVLIGVLPVVIVCVAAVAIIAGLKARGVIYFGTKQSSQKIYVSDHVCDDLIDKANQITNGQSGGTINTTIQYNNLQKTIVGRDGYNQDPTCDYILLNWSIYTSSDYKTAKTYYDKISALADQGIYPNNKLRYTLSLPELKEMFDMRE
jgi:hypothetical protein